MRLVRGNQPQSLNQLELYGKCSKIVFIFALKVDTRTLSQRSKQNWGMGRRAQILAFLKVTLVIDFLSVKLG